MTELQWLEQIYGLMLYVSLFGIAVFGLLTGWFISGR